jgi:uncharacterized protein YjbJ (UPF0337 family)
LVYGLLFGECPTPWIDPQAQLVSRAARFENHKLLTQKGWFAMDWDRVAGNWKQIKGKVKEKWGKLTDDDLTAINGRRDQLEGKIQERYGYAKDQARKEVEDWYNTQNW